MVIALALVDAVIRDADVKTVRDCLGYPVP